MARDAWRVFRRAPLRIGLLSVLPIVFEAACQAVPGAGIALSKALTPLVSAWALLMLDARVRGGAFAPMAALRTWRSRGMLLAGVSALGLAMFAFQLGIAALIAGSGAAHALSTGDVAALGMDRAQLALVLASGLLPAIGALAHAAGWIDGLRPGRWWLLALGNVPIVAVSLLWGRRRDAALRRRLEDLEALRRQLVD